MAMKQSRKRLIGKHSCALDEAVDSILDGVNSPYVVIGPLLWRPTDGLSSRYDYFVVATSENGRGFRCDQMICRDELDRLEFKLALISRASEGLPLVIFDTGDELEMIKLCETLWPGERVSRIRQNVEKERQQPCR